MPLVSRINVNLLATLTNSLDLGLASLPIDFTHAYSFASGTGANQADMIWADQRTLAASATEDLDFAGVLTNLLTGAAMTFARIKAIGVFAAAANTNNVNVTRPASNGVVLYLAAGDGEAIHPGGCTITIWPGATAIPITAGTGDLITVTNSAAGTAVTYDIVVIGASA